MTPEATLATMVEDAYVNHVPVMTGGFGNAPCELSIRVTLFLLCRPTRNLHLFHEPLAGTSLLTR